MVQVSDTLGSEILNPGEYWDCNKYQTLEISPEEGEKQNIYVSTNYNDLGRGMGIVLTDGAGLWMQYQERGIYINGRRATGNRDIWPSISGQGQLEISTTIPGTWYRTTSYYSSLWMSSLANGNEGYFNITGDIDLTLKSYRGIVVETGYFQYENPSGTIEISGSNPEESGLLNGILAIAEVDEVVSSIDITANSLTIKSNGQTPLGDDGNQSNRNELISTSALGTRDETPYEKNKGTALIKINANNITLEVGSDYKPGYDGGGGWGIYGQAGFSIVSKILLSGDTFSFTCPVDGWNGIYSITFAKENHISLVFSGSINFALNGSSNGIETYRYLAEQQDLSVIDLKSDTLISLQNSIGSMIYNAGSIVNAFAPVVTINSGGENAINTVFFSAGTPTESGVTNIGGNVVNISSDGNAASSYAVVTQGNTSYQAPNGFTNISGQNITIKSQNAAAIYSSDTGTTSVGNPLSITFKETPTGDTTVEIPSAEVVQIHSVDGSAIITETAGTTSVSGNAVIIGSKSGSAIVTESAGTTTISGANVLISPGELQAITPGSPESGYQFSPTSDELPYIVWTDGEGSTTSINYSSGAPTQTTTIAGRLLATNQGVTNIGLGSQSSQFTGSTDDGAFYQNPTSSSSSAFGNDLTTSTDTSQTKAGQISIYAANRSKWIVQPNPVSLADEVQGVMNKWSNLSLYESNGFSIVDLTQPGTNPNAGQDLNIVQLQGNGAAFMLRTYIDDNQPVHGGEINGDDTSQIRDHVNIIQGKGLHFIVLNSSGIGVTESATGKVPDQGDYLVWVSNTADNIFPINDYDPDTYKDVEIPDGQLAFKLGKLTSDSVSSVASVKAMPKIDKGVYTYYLATREAEDGKGTEWYLKTNGEPDPGPEPEPDPDPTPDPDPDPDPTPDPEPEPEPGPTPTPDPEYSPSTDVLRELAGFGAQYAIWWADLSDLRKRLGEVRYGAQDGAWARVITQKDNVSGVGYGGFTQKLYAVNIGIDHFAIQDEDRMWLLGGNFKYANANQRVKRSQYGKGDVHSWGMNLYATYANQYGCYSDFVLTYDHYQSKLHTRMLDDTPVGAKWNNYGYGVSLEVGKMFSSTQNDEGWGPWYNHWWIEPQAQLAYYRIHGKSFTMSNGMKADPGNIDFLTGRLGVVIGKKFNYGKDRAVVDKRYSQFYIKGGIKHEFLGKQRLTVSDTVNEVTFKGNFRGTRVYYGGGFDWNFTDQLRLYAQIERENGGKYKKDYEISVGLKWQF